MSASQIRRIDPFAPFVAENLDGDPHYLIVCDHASNHIPPSYALGLTPASLARHIAYDIGAADVARRIADALGCPLILANFSRLLIDPNRGLDDPTLIMQLSDGDIIAGNRKLDSAARQARIDGYYAPYHEAIGAAIDRACDAGYVPLLLSVHSFTPLWKGAQRPWEVALLWDKDPRLQALFAKRLAAIEGVTIGDNVPYSGRLRGDTMYRHGTQKGLPHVLVELRQDEIADETARALWATRLADIMREANRTDAMHEIRHYGSHTP